MHHASVTSIIKTRVPFVLQLLDQGLHVYTWKSVEAADFVEHASYLVCDDLHRNLGVVQTNFREICAIASSWSENCQLHVFTLRDSSKSFSMEKLQEQHRLVLIKKESYYHFQHLSTLFCPKTHKNQHYFYWTTRMSFLFGYKTSSNITRLTKAES